jgi:replication factor C subunit 3/5
VTLTLYRDVGYFDRVVIQELLKDIAQTAQIDTTAKHRFKGSPPVIKIHFLTCVVVVINEADNLTRDAQSALRRTMEKYSPNIRLILVANSSTKILAPIRSRCLLVRVAAPTNDDVVAALRGVVQAENLGKVGSGVLEKIAGESRRNLRRALLMLEAVYAQKYHHPPRILCFAFEFFGDGD